MPTFRITSIECHGTQEHPNNDEVFIQFQPDANIPVHYPFDGGGYQRMNTNADSNDDVVQTWQISDLEISFENECLVTLWDADGSDFMHSTINEPSFLINHDYNSTNLTGAFTMGNHNGANYTINTIEVE